MKKIESIKADKQKNAVRLSDFVVGKFEAIPTRKGMKKAIDKGLVKVNQRTARTSDYIYGGEIIELHREKGPSSRTLLDLKVEVVFEDEDIAVVNKPAGIVVSGNQHRTLTNALPNNLEASTKRDALVAPQPVHRLDHATSGLLVIAKTRTALTQMAKIFEERKIKKVYHAVAIGVMPKEGVVEKPLKGKSAKTEYQVLQTVESKIYKFFNLVQIHLHTGRRHQIRVHLSDQGNPVLGDQRYGQEGLILRGKGLYLHASGLEFVHPVTQETISQSLKLPNKFKKLFPGSDEEE